MEAFPAYAVDAEELSTREILVDSGIDPLLGEMLLCPTCYYGSARPNDIDFPTFIMLFDAIFRQGLSRPENGIRAILDPLTEKLNELGVDRRMNCAVDSISVKGDQVNEVILASGEIIKANKIISTCGIRETEILLNQNDLAFKSSETGEFSVIESIRVLNGHPQDLGWEETVIFFNDDEHFKFICPNNLVDLTSGVICMPDNYGCPDLANESKIRVTHPANFAKWSELSYSDYQMKKKFWEQQMMDNSLRFLSEGETQKASVVKKTKFIDTFTPTTVKKYTSHVNGTLYGSPTKSRDGSTKFKNLFLAGTDQGYVGIVGSMLGGIAVANSKILQSG